jgi:putative intracellular protease/amidase
MINFTYRKRNKIIIFLVLFSFLFLFLYNLEGGGSETMSKLQGKKILMIIASQNFRDEELFKPRELFIKEGMEVILASSSLEVSRGMLGGTAKPDIAGILDKKKATVFRSEVKAIKRKGAIYTGKAVEVDGNIITAEGPQAATEFGQTIINALSEKMEK